MEDDIKEIKEELKQVNEKVGSHEASIIRLEESHSFIKKMAEDVVNVSKALNETMQDMKITLVSMEGNLSEISGKVEGVSDRMDKFEDETNINILSVIKKNWVTLVVIVAFAAYYISNNYGVRI